MRFATASASCGAALSLFAVAGCSVLLDANNLTDGARGGAGGGMGGAPSTGGSSAGGGAGGDAGNASGGTAGAALGGFGGFGGMSAGGSSAGEPELAGAAGSMGTCETTSTKELCDGIDNDCDSLTPDVCPSGCSGVTYHGVGYMVCSGTHSFDDAEALCVKQAMHLVKVDDNPENTFVLSLVKPLTQAAWIGASDEALSRTFVWLDGKTIVYANGATVKDVFQNFATGQPANMPGPNCLEMSRGTTPPAGEWLDAVCTNTQPFVCERY